MKVLTIYYYALANNENISDTQNVKLLTAMLVSFLLNTREKLSKAVPWLIPLTFGVLHLPLGVNMYLGFLESVEVIAPKDVDCKFSFVFSFIKLRLELGYSSFPCKSSWILVTSFDLLTIRKYWYIFLQACLQR